MNHLSVAEQFLADVFTGKMSEALNRCAEDVRFVPTRPQGSDKVRMYGTYQGREGGEAFFRGFGELLEPGDFVVLDKVSDDRHVVMYGTLRHKARNTGKEFASDWALVMKFDHAGKIVLYHFYEDTAALEQALGVTGAS